MQIVQRLWCLAKTALDCHTVANQSKNILCESLTSAKNTQSLQRSRMSTESRTSTESRMTNSTISPSIEDIDELYAAYSEFMNDSRRALLEGNSNAAWSETITHLAAPKRKADFKERLMRLDEPQLNEFRSRIKRGWLNGEEFAQR